MEKIIEKIIENLTDDLLKKQFRELEKRNKFSGHCYVATEALFHSLNKEQQKEYRPARMKINGITHWFLKNKKNGKIIDITKNQFDFPIKYDEAINCFFLTKKPSKRCLTLLNRIK